MLIKKILKANAGWFFSNLIYFWTFTFETIYHVNQITFVDYLWWNNLINNACVTRTKGYENQWFSFQSRTRENERRDHSLLTRIIELSQISCFSSTGEKKTQFYLSRYFFFKYSIINIHILAIFWRGDLIDDSVPTTLQYNKWISMRVLIAELVCLISIFVSF